MVQSDKNIDLKFEPSNEQVKRENTGEPVGICRLYLTYRVILSPPTARITMTENTTMM